MELMRSRLSCEGFPDAQALFTCHLLFLLLDHLLNHIAADAAVLVRSQIAVVAVCERHSELILRSPF